MSVNLPSDPFTWLHAAIAAQLESRLTINIENRQRTMLSTGPDSNRVTTWVFEKIINRYAGLVRPVSLPRLFSTCRQIRKPLLMLLKAKKVMKVGTFVFQNEPSLRA